jgi:hypothetical protein
VLRLIGFLLAATISISGFMYVDYSMAQRWTVSEEGDSLTIREYIGGFADRLTGASANAAAEAGLPTALVDMMPKPPEGWVMRPTVAADTDAFMPKRSEKKTKEARDYVQAVAKKRSGKGVDLVVQTYEKGEQRVIFQVARYPNLIFTNASAIKQRTELQTLAAKFRPRNFMTVRGLDVTEDMLPSEMRARYFLADVGAQIQIRVVASERMTDQDLLAFFQTMHVKAMNASVVDRDDGLGDVPIIVLVSVLDEAARAAYDADRASRAEAKAARREAARNAAEAEAEEEATAYGSPPRESKPKLQGDTGNKPGTGCEIRAGTRFCGTGADSN